MKLRQILPAIAIQLLCLSSPFAQENFNIEHISSYFTQWSEVSGVAVQNEYVWLSTGNTGLVSLEFNESQQLIDNQGIIEVNGTAGDLEIQGNFLYLVVESYWRDTYFLALFDISDPTSISETGRVEVPDARYAGLSVDGEYASISFKNQSSGQQREGIYLVNISEEENPVVDSFLEIDEARQSVLSGNYCYVGCRDEGLVVVDVSDADNPEVIADPNEIENVDKLLMHGDYLYALDRALQGDLKVIDVSAPGDPDIVHTINLVNLSNAEEIYLADSKLYVMDENDMYIYNLSNSHVPDFISSSDFGGHFAATSGNYLFIGDDDYYNPQIHVYDVSDLSEPEEITNLISDLALKFISHDGNYIYAAGYDNMLVFDISDPAEPNIQTQFSLNDHTPYDFDIIGNYVYSSSRSRGLMIIDISDPFAPTHVNVYEDLDGTDLFSHGDYGYLVSEDTDLKIIDISTPSAPVLLETITIDANCMKTVADENLLFIITEHDGIGVYDISIPDSPQVEAWIDTEEEARSLEIDGDYAFAGFDRGDQFIIYSIADLNNIVAIGTYNIGTSEKISAIEVVGDRVFLLGINNPIYALNISNPASPYLAGFYDPGYSRWRMSMVLDEGIMYVQDHCRLDVYDYSDALGVPESVINNHQPEEFTITSLYPNPFNATIKIEYYLPRFSDVSIKIYNLLGQQVSQELIPASIPGYHQFTINGEQWVSGIYLLRCDAAGYSQTRKVCLLK